MFLLSFLKTFFSPRRAHLHHATVDNHSAITFTFSLSFSSPFSFLLPSLPHPQPLISPPSSPFPATTTNHHRLKQQPSSPSLINSTEDKRRKNGGWLDQKEKRRKKGGRLDRGGRVDGWMPLHNSFPPPALSFKTMMVAAATTTTTSTSISTSTATATTTETPDSSSTTTAFLQPNGFERNRV